ncbi:ribonuclease HII, partial [Micromonospora provocatoris]
LGPGAFAGRPDEPMGHRGASGGTVGVALGEQPRPPASVGEDVVMEGGVR